MKPILFGRRDRRRPALSRHRLAPREAIHFDAVSDDEGAVLTRHWDDKPDRVELRRSVDMDDRRRPAAE